MDILNLLVIYKEQEAASIDRATLRNLKVEDDTVVATFADGSQVRIGPYESNIHAVQVWSEIYEALANGPLILNIWKSRPVKKS